MRTIRSTVIITLSLCGIFLPRCFGQDIDEAILGTVIEKEVAQSPENHALRIVAAFHFFDMGNYSKAEEHFARASKLTPDDPYDQAWLYMTQLRRDPKASGKTIRAFVKRMDSNAFIYTNINILLEEITLAEALKSAKASKDLGTLCEAHYYAAQRLLADGEKQKVSDLQNQLKQVQTAIVELQKKLTL